MESVMERNRNYVNKLFEIVYIEFYVGVHIEHAIVEAIKQANQRNKPVGFKFNGVFELVMPSEEYDTIIKRFVKQRKEMYGA